MAEQSSESRPAASESEEESRRFNTSVMAGSVAPRKAAWLFHGSEGSWPEFGHWTLGERVLVLSSIVLGLVAGGLVTVALATGDDAHVAYALFGLLGVIPVVLILLFAIKAVTSIAARLRRET
jgi:hypothetical protein